MGALIPFFLDSLRMLRKGPPLYWAWLTLLAVLVAGGAHAYLGQFEEGLIVTGMSDQVSWGVYIANFTFLVGVAASALMLVLPAYVLGRTDRRLQDIGKVVVFAEAMAVSAIVMCLLFVTVDMGRPDRFWHLIPLLGRFNFPHSLLAWDVVVLTGYLALNLAIPFYFLFSRYRDVEPHRMVYFPFVVLSVAWAIGIHTVTAFLFSSNVGRPFWFTGMMGPRFLASAFCSGPAVMILMLQVLGKVSRVEINPRLVEMLSYVTTVSLQVTLFMLGAELFTEFYSKTEHATSAEYLYFGLRGYSSLVPWIWLSIALNVSAAWILSVHPLRRRRPLLNTACVLLIAGVWIEKGMGLIIPGFIPTPIGEIMEYSVSATEVSVSLGILAIGLLVFTLLAKIAIPIEDGLLQYAPASHSPQPRRSAND